MLFRIRSAVIAFALISGSLPAYAQNGGAANAPVKPATATAVVDLDHVFDNHPVFNTQKEELKALYQKTMEDFEARRKKLASEAEALNANLNPDSPEFKKQQESLVQQESKMRLDVMNKEKEFGERQAKLILDTYNNVTQAVEVAARHYQFDLVVRYSRKQAASMDAKKPQSVMMGVADREVIYFNPERDLTETVITMLNQQHGVQPSAKQPVQNAGTPGVNPANPNAPRTANPGLGNNRK